MNITKTLMMYYILRLMKMSYMSNVNNPFLCRGCKYKYRSEYCNRFIKHKSDQIILVEPHHNLIKMPTIYEIRSNHTYCGPKGIFYEKTKFTF